MRRHITRTGVVRRQRHQRYAIKTWCDRLPDVPAFIIGNGPSINDQNLDMLNNYFSIGTNRIFYRFDPTILMWQDISLWTTEYHKLHNTQAIKVARDVADPRRIYYNFHLKGGDYKFEQHKSHIMYGRGSTGPLAVQFAVSLGCRPLIILGMDCKRGPKQESDFYGDNQHWLPHTLVNCKLGLDFIKESCPVEVINCSDNSLWERQDLKKVIENIDPKYARGRQSYVKQLLQIP